MFALIGVEGKTNPRLRATGASDLFQAGVAEKIVQERTGHRSIKALRMYERTTTAQRMEVSSILAGCEAASKENAIPPVVLGLHSVQYLETPPTTSSTSM